jgi:predicted PurR-regulated permease PerM
MARWFDEFGNHLRDPAELRQERRTDSAFRRLFLSAFGIAAIIGLVLGIVWTIAGLWHAHVSRPF